MLIIYFTRGSERHFRVSRFVGEVNFFFSFREFKIVANTI